MKARNTKPVTATKRQLAILAAISFGEVYAQLVRAGRKGGYVHWFERTGWGEFDKPIDITATLYRMSKSRLVRFQPINRGWSRDEWERIVVVTERARDLAEDRCIDLL